MRSTGDFSLRLLVASDAVAIYIRRSLKYSCSVRNYFQRPSLLIKVVKRGWPHARVHSSEMKFHRLPLTFLDRITAPGLLPVSVPSPAPLQVRNFLERPSTNLSLQNKPFF